MTIRSMLGAWGPRTVNGKLYTMRNLDWAANTGIADNKLITIFHPVGKRAHATIGFAGMYLPLACTSLYPSKEKKGFLMLVLCLLSIILHFL